MAGLQRHIAAKITRLLTQFPVVAILGARQAGKTELAKQLCPDWHYVDLERSDDFELVNDDPQFFFKQYPDHVIIDEAQECPALFKTLRGVIDEKRQQKGRFILTGSSSPTLLNRISESLAGRIAIVELGTLKASEYYEKPLSKFYSLFSQKLSKEALPLGTPPLSSQQMQYVWLKGGYPEPLLHSDDENFYADWLENYQQTYVFRDIAQLFPKLDKLAFRRFLLMLGQVSGTMINRSVLGRAIGVSESTIKDYMEIADGTYLWRTLPSYENSSIKSLVKMPKGHLRDSALLHHFLKITDMNDLINNIHLGQSFESFAIEELIKGLQASNVTNWDYHYFRTRGGAEVDLILYGPFGTLPIEIKHNTHTPRQKLSSLRNFVETQNLPFGILINQSEAAMWLSETIFQLPIGWL